MNGWQTIESAPKDGTEIDLWCKAIDCEFRATDAKWNPAFGNWQVSDYPLQDAFGNVGVHATHGMPCPEPPK